MDFAQRPKLSNNETQASRHERLAEYSLITKPPTLKTMKKTITITSSHQAGHNIISLDGFEDITYISDLAPDLECFDVIKNILDCYGINLEVQAQTGNDYHCATPEND